MIYDKISSLLKEGVTKEQVEGALKGFLNPGELSKDGFVELIKTNKGFESLFDSEVNKRRDSGVKNWEEKEMPKILKAKEDEIRLKYNPKEDKAEKVAREFEEYKQGIAREKELASLKDELSQLAPDMGIDGVFAREFASFKEPKEAMEKFSSYLKEKMSPLVKDQFNKKPPKTGGIDKGLANMTAEEMNAAALANPSNKPAILEEIKRRQQTLT